MLDLPISSVIEPRKLVLAAPDASVAQAARRMMRGNVGAVMVVEDSRLVGIFTERDALFRVMAQGLDPSTTMLRDVMTPDPITVKPDESFGYALLVMHENGFRHLPVVDSGRPVGIVSARHALDPDLEEFTVEASRRERIRQRPRA
jgi:CBS domain-containing protein